MGIVASIQGHCGFKAWGWPLQLMGLYSFIAWFWQLQGMGMTTSAQGLYSFNARALWL
jgi:hypothetical protein